MLLIRWLSDLDGSHGAQTRTTVRDHVRTNLRLASRNGTRLNRDEQPLERAVRTPDALAWFPPD